MIRKISTKKLLAKSMLDLSKRTRVEKITVTEIARNCGVSRETFYYYFCDKYELISYIFTVAADEIMDKYDGTLNWSDTLGQFVEHFYKHYHFFRSALNDKSVNNFKQDLIHYTRNVMEQSIRNRYGDDIITEEILFQLQFYAFGSANNVTLWLLQNGKEEPKKIGQMLYDSMSPSLRTLFP